VLSRSKPALFIQPTNFKLAFSFLRIDIAMPSNKPRLHIFLYVRGNNNPCREDTYYWALLVIPKSENEGTDPAQKRYHITNTEPVLGHRLPPWHFNIIPLRGVHTSRLLVRITVAKVENLPT